MVGACPYPAPQGSQVLLQDTALALGARGHDVHVVVYGYGAGPDETGLAIHRCAPVPGAKRIAAGFSPAKPILDLALLRTLRRVIREKRIEIVHAHNYEGLVVGLAARKRPVIYHAHNVMADELPHYVPGTRRVGHWLDRVLPRRADHVIALHERQAEYLLACGCVAARVSVIPPALDVAPFPVSRPSHDVPPVLYAGNLDTYQNLAFLVKVMARVRQRLPQARLIVATPQKGALPGAEILPTPDFNALRRVLAQDAVAVCPRVSWSGYPIKTLNAMASGKAVVACAAAAFPVIHEESGLVVSDNDVAAFAEAVIRLLTNPGLRAALGKNARAYVATFHAPEKIAAAIERTYAAALARCGLPEHGAPDAG